MKKILLGLGTLAAIVAPITSVVACGSGTESDPANVDPNTSKTLTANQLVELNSAVDLGVQSATYVSTIKLIDPATKEVSGDITLKFQATKANNIGSVNIAANQDVTIVFTPPRFLVDLTSIAVKVNGTTVESSGKGVSGLIALAGELVSSESAINQVSNSLTADQLVELNSAVDLGVQSATYVSTVKVINPETKEVSGDITLKFQATKANNIGSVNIAANQDVTIVFTPPRFLVDLTSIAVKVNGTTVESSGKGVSGLIALAGELITPQASWLS